MNFRIYDNDGSATLKISAFKVSFGDNNGSNPVSQSFSESLENPTWRDFLKCASRGCSLDVALLPRGNVVGFRELC